MVLTGGCLRLGRRGGASGRLAFLGLLLLLAEGGLELGLQVVKCVRRYSKLACAFGTRREARRMEVGSPSLAEPREARERRYIFSAVTRDPRPDGRDRL